jgi:hypothetical protein
MIIQLAKVLRVSGVSERTPQSKEVRKDDATARSSSQTADASASSQTADASACGQADDAPRRAGEEAVRA